MPPGLRKRARASLSVSTMFSSNGIVAERLGHDHVDAVGLGDLGRMHLGDAAVGQPVVAQQLARHGGDVGRS